MAVKGKGKKATSGKGNGKKSSRSTSSVTPLGASKRAPRGVTRGGKKRPHQTGGTHRREVALVKAPHPAPPPTPEEFEKTRTQFFEMWSDPLNTDSEVTMAKKLKTELSQLVRWRLDPAFYQAAWKRYQETLQVSIIPIMRKMVGQAQEGSPRAIEKILEMLGMIEGKGAKINVFNVTGKDGFDSQFIRELSDSELDVEIDRLFRVLYLGDVRLRGKEVTPAKDVEFETVGEVSPESVTG